MICLILAGGFATRMYPKGAQQAKALLSYKGQPVISHLINSIPSHIPVLVTTNKKFEASFLQWKNQLDRDISILTEDTLTDEQKPGAVGAINLWVQKMNIKEDLWIIAGDNYFEGDLPEFVETYDGVHSLVAIYDVGTRTKAKQMGVIKLEGDKIVDLIEKPSDPESSLIATACYIFPPSIFPLLRSYCSQQRRDHLGTFISYLIQNSDVYAYSLTSSWLDIGSLYQE